MNDQHPTGPATRGSEQSRTDQAPELPGDARQLVHEAWRPLLVVLAVLSVIVIARPAQLVQRLDPMRDWIHSQGLLGLAIVLGVYVIAAVALVPQTVLKVAAGGLFGSWLGVLMASVGSTVGALACFVIARYVARGSWMQRLKRGPRIRELDLMSRERGTLLVIVGRILPIFPGNLLNYALGLTQVRLATFTFWSWLCMLPGVVVLVVGTDALLRGLAEGRVPWGLVSIVVAMLGVLAASVVVILRRVRFRGDRQALAER